MSVYIDTSEVTLHHGDCLDVLASLPDGSVDSVVTDPPYGLANTDPSQVADTITRWVNGERDYLPGGSGFMGKAWDAFVPPVAVWDECLRVLKPGGHVLAFAGTRTVDLMTLGLRLAGFDIRDSIAWMYGSGFPKSLDVSKAIDKRPGVTMHPTFAAELTAARQAAGMTTHEVAERVVGSRTGACWNWEHHQFPEAKWWPALRDLLGMDGERWDAVIAEVERAKTGKHKAGLSTGASGLTVAGEGKDRRDSAATDAAREWQGWGTALKPAFEPVVVARKPLAGTVAANVLKYGTGALNIDASRIGTSKDVPASAAAPQAGNAVGFGSTTALAERSGMNPNIGRFPANVILDESQAAELDKQSGVSQSRIGKPRGAASGEGWGMTATGTEYDDLGGASRFFYTAKADSSERPVVDGIAHPTVKPLDLMRYLVRLVTPKGGVVLEPFAGSGTTLEAAVLEGFRAIGIEREADYLPLILKRLEKPHAVGLDLFGDVA